MLDVDSLKSTIKSAILKYPKALQNQNNSPLVNGKYFFIFIKKFNTKDYKDLVSEINRSIGYSYLKKKISKLPKEEHYEFEINYEKFYLVYSEFSEVSINNPNRAQDKTFNQIRPIIQNLTKNNSIKVKIGNTVLENVKSIRQEPKDQNSPQAPKCDFYLTDNSGKKIYFISQKSSKTSSALNQYGGISNLKNFYPEIDTFLNDVYSFSEDAKINKKDNNYFYSNGNLKTAIYREIQDDDLIIKSIYGKDYGKGSYGINNVNAFVQGDEYTLNYDEKENLYVMSSLKMFFNPDITFFKNDPNYRAVLAVFTRGENRNTSISPGKSYIGRTGIVPYKLISSRSPKEI